MIAAARPRLTVMHVDTERGWRGGEQQVLWLAEALERRGVRSLVAARPREPLARRAHAAGLTVVPCEPVSELAPLAAASLRRAIKQQGVRIVHAHTAHAIALAALASRGTEARMVVTRHVQFAPRNNFATRWKYRRADAVIAVSEAARRVLAESKVARAQIDVVPVGVDLGRDVEPASPATLAALGVPPGAPLVVLVAALTAEKEPATFVRAVAAARTRVPSLHALVVGDGPERKGVEEAIHRHGLEAQLHLAGFRDDAAAMMAAADAVVLTSRDEGLPVSLLEALALGRPVIATAAGGVAELIEHGRSGLLAPVGDAGRLGAAIADVLSDARLAAGLSDGARARAAHFAIDLTAERTVEIYERVLASR